MLEFTANIFIDLFGEHYCVCQQVSKQPSKTLSEDMRSRNYFHNSIKIVFALFTLIMSGQRSFPKAACYMISQKTEQTSRYKK